MGVTKSQATTRREGPKEKSSNVDWSAIGSGSASGGVSWNDADPVFLASVVYLGTRAGMAVSFSATANGQAVSVTFLDGPNRPRYYANTPQELADLLKKLNEALP